jgi:hypothetical protein
MSMGALSSYLYFILRAKVERRQIEWEGGDWNTKYSVTSLFTLAWLDFHIIKTSPVYIYFYVYTKKNTIILYASILSFITSVRSSHPIPTSPPKKPNLILSDYRPSDL